MCGFVILGRIFFFVIFAILLSLTSYSVGTESVIDGSKVTVVTAKSIVVAAK